MFHRRAYNRIIAIIIVFHRDNIVCFFILLTTPLLQLKVCIVIRYAIEILLYLFIYLRRYGLYNDAAGSSDYRCCIILVRNDKSVMNWNWCRRTRSGHNLRHSYGIFLEWLKKTVKNFSHNSRSPVRGLNSDLLNTNKKYQFLDCLFGDLEIKNDELMTR
jgi:hypothetical protein